jgi:phosphoenolpyruvate---glycerone phosphotransferase subunit DhaK
MKKFINSPDNLVSELLEGYTLAYSDKVKLEGDNLVVRTVPKGEGKVGIVTLGGSGHEPGLSGFVGEGLLDISVPGEIFAAPSAGRCLDAIKRADRGAGVLFIVLNHEGDVLSSDLTLEMAETEQLEVKRLLTSEDISAAPRSDPENRRGLVGFLPVYKVTGSAAEQGRSLDEVYEVGKRLERNMATLSVAVTPATHPETGESMFTLGEDEMEVGMGQHGEAGTGRGPLKSADETAETMLEALLNDLEVKKGEDLLVIVNGTGATTLMEQFIIYRRVHKMLESKGINPARSLIGEYITVQEQGGFQLFIARMDDELLELWDAPCDSPYLTFR